MKNVLILGAGGHARVVLDAILASRRANPVGFLDDRPTYSTVDHLPVLGRIDQFREFAKANDIQAAIVAVGSNHTRRSIVNRIEAANGPVEWLHVAHPSSVISPTAEIGAGAVIFAGCVINPGVSIGAHCIINTKSSIDHDTVFEQFSSTGPGVLTGGDVLVGKGSHVGIGAVLKHQVRIGQETIVGAGSVVISNIPDNCVAYGNPATVIRARAAEDPYF